MTASSFARALTAVLKHEGGYVNHPDDPGGATNKGITLATFRAYVKKGGTVQDLKNITDVQVATVYRKHYWDAVKGDALPAGVDYAVFDFAVNSGPSRAIKFLQNTVGASADGVIGHETMAAVMAHAPGAIVDQLCARRLAWLKTLSTWKTFGKGWSNRVKGVRKLGMEMAVAPVFAPPPPEPPDAHSEPPEQVGQPVIEPVTKDSSESFFIRLMRALWAAIRGA